LGYASAQIGERRRGALGRIREGERGRPGDGDFGAGAIGQLDQVTRFGKGLISGPPQNLDNLIIQRMMGMRHPDHSVLR
jgi:hypothetical protein